MRERNEGYHMLRNGLIAVLLLGLGSTAMASDRVRVYVGVDGYYGDVGYRLSHVEGGRDYGRWDGRRSYRGDGRHYSAPRGYYYYPRPYYGPRHGYSRGYGGGRHWHDRRHDGHRWHRH